MADDKKEDASLEPDELDEVAGGAIDSYSKLQDKTDGFLKIDSTESG